MQSETALSLAAVSDAYFAAWEARDPDRIIAMHSEDTVFQIHAGAGPVSGRDAVRDTFAGLFEQWPDFGFEVRRLLFGDDHWVLDWTLRSSGGPAGDTRFGCLDVVAIDEDGLVSRKDTYVDMAELTAALGSA